MKILIIEDEKKTALELKRMIEKVNKNAEVWAIIATVSEGIDWLNAHGNEVELIFSDIQLADGLSFDIFNQIEPKVPIVFCTAFEEYAIKAFETNGIDYLLKPIDESKLEHALNKLEQLQKKSESDYSERLHSLLDSVTKPYKQSLLAYYQNKIVPLKVSEIEFIHSNMGIVTAYLQNNRHFVLSQTLDKLEDVLDPEQFYKANRQFIVNRDAITNIEHYFTRRLAVSLRTPTPEQIIVSKIKASDFLDWIER